jgi:hypothetical protein
VVEGAEVRHHESDEWKKDRWWLEENNKEIRGILPRALLIPYIIGGRRPLLQSLVADFLLVSASLAAASNRRG